MYGRTGGRERTGGRCAQGAVRALLGVVASIGVCGNAAAQDCVPHWDTAIGQPGLNSWVYRAMTTYNGDLIVGGNFTSAGGVPVNRIARWDGREWHPLGAGLNGPVTVLFVHEGELLAGGFFTTAGRVAAVGLARWDGSEWHEFAGGVQDGIVDPGCKDIVLDDCVTGTGVLALIVHGGDLYVGGNFQSAGAKRTPANFIARWDGREWHPLGEGMSVGVDDGLPTSVVPEVQTMAVFNGDLIAGGSFNAAGGQQIRRVARWDGTQWHPLGAANNFSNSVLDLAIFDGDLIAATDTQLIGGSLAINFIARWDGTQWHSMGGGFQGCFDWATKMCAPLALAIFDEGTGPSLYAGGEFLGVGGQQARHTARWDGSQWHTMGAGTNSPVSGLTVHDDGSGLALYVAGHFQFAGGKPAANIARWNGFDRSVTRWVPAPASGGEFGEGANWSSGFAPAPGDYLAFGEVPGTGIFDVPVSKSYSIAGLCVGNQRPHFQLASGSVLGVDDYLRVGASQSAALHVSGGTLVAPVVEVAQHGRLHADASVNGELLNAGLVQPGSGLAPGGLLLLNGNYSQAPGAFFRTAIGPSAFDAMIASGSAQIAGTLQAELVDSANPALGASFPILTAETIDGVFSAAVLPFLGSDRFMTVTYEGTSAAGVDAAQVKLVIVPPGSSPNFGGADVVVVEGQPVGVVSASLDEKPRGSARDLAVLMRDDEQEEGFVVILGNDGSGTNFDLAFVPVGRGASGITVLKGELLGRFYGDELLVANRDDNSITIIFNKGNGSFEVEVIEDLELKGPSALGVGLFSISRPEQLALLVANQDGDSVAIFVEDEMKDDIVLHQEVSLGIGSAPIALAIEELGDDDDPSIIVLNGGTNSVTILQNYGFGFFADSQTLGTPGKPVAMAVDDIDNTKRNDLVVLSETFGFAGDAGGSGMVSVYRNLGGGFFAEPLSLPLAGVPTSLDVGDMDGDGDVDIVVVIQHEEYGEVVQILRNDSTAAGGGLLLFTLMPPLVQDEMPQLVHRADVTGDGLDDLVTVNLAESSGVAGDKSFESSVTLFKNLLGDSETRPCPGDITGDEIVDIFDLLAVLAAWGTCPQPEKCPADITGDEIVDIFDLLAVLAAWGPCPG